LFLSELNLQHFRMFRELEISLNPEFNLFHGNNGQGKTTLLEAIRFLSTGRSFLTDSPKEMISFGSDYFFLKGTLLKEALPFEIKFGWSEKGKKVSINGNPLKVLSDLLGVMDTVLFTAADFELVCGTPQEKRLFLDIQLSQADPGYLDLLKTYQRVLRQRNALLKGKRYAKKELESWSMTLIRTGAAIMSARIKAIRDIENFARNFLNILSCDTERLDVQYRSSIPAGSLSEMEKEFHDRLEQAAEKEREAGYTFLGPHRDDLLFTLNGHEAKKYASRGQIKCMVISLKLAESEHLHSRKGVAPLFLIDDVFSELDKKRRSQFVRILKSGDQQVVIGTTHPDDLIRDIQPERALKTYEVISGRVA
jgi:DNA replication and repair protein RecF